MDLNYDQFDGANFLVILEKALIETDQIEIEDFYKSYLHHYFTYSEPPQLDYPSPLAEIGYSKVVHYGLLLFLNDGFDISIKFKAIREIEASFDPWALWEPVFGLSQDHDQILLYYFPFLITLFCLGFCSSVYAPYFTVKLKNILDKALGFGYSPKFGCVLLLIASQLSQDKERYDYAREFINGEGGISLQVLRNPSVFLLNGDPNFYESKDLTLVPQFDRWKNWIEENVSLEQTELFKSIVQGFLISPWKKDEFIAHCLRKSIDGF